MHEGVESAEKYLTGLKVGYVSEQIVTEKEEKKVRSYFS